MIRRIPLSLHPLDDESLVSFVSRVAAYNELPLATLLPSIGLPIRDPRRSPLDAYAVATPDPVLEAFAHAVDIEPDHAAAMTLRRFDGATLRFPDEQSPTRLLPLLGMREWAFVLGSQLCPNCLRAQGRLGASNGSCHGSSSCLTTDASWSTIARSVSTAGSIGAYRASGLQRPWPTGLSRCMRPRFQSERPQI